MTDNIENLIRREIQRALKGIHPTVGVVTSYDPKKQAVKCTHQPDGNESGWIPVAKHTSGATSFCTGPKGGEQVVIGYLNGDRESPVVMGFLHSDKDLPPETASGDTTLNCAGTLTISAAQVNITGPVAVNGATLTHNGKDVGSDHTHSGVQTGSGNTGAPV